MIEAWQVRCAWRAFSTKFLPAGNSVCHATSLHQKKGRVAFSSRIAILSHKLMQGWGLCRACDGCISMRAESQALLHSFELIEVHQHALW